MKTHFAVPKGDEEECPFCEDGRQLIMLLEGKNAGLPFTQPCRCKAGASIYDSVRRGIDDLDHGRVRSLEEVAKELGIPLLTEDEKKERARQRTRSHIQLLKSQISDMEASLENTGGAP